MPGNSAGKPAYEPRRFRLLGPDTAGIGDHITNSTTGNPNAIYLHHFTQFATNLSKLDPPSPHPSTPGKTHRRTLTEITFHQYYFKGPTADPSGRQFIDVGILDSLRPKIEIALAQVARPLACQRLFSLDCVSHTDVVAVFQAKTATVGATLGETSSAYDGGAPGLSASFASTFGWVDKLGMSARLGLKRVMRQELCCVGPADSHALLADNGRSPTPDFWATVLWKRLMGSRVLAVRGDDVAGRTVRVYAHCLARVPHRRFAGGVALAVINLRNSSVALDGIAVSDSRGGSEMAREVFALGTAEGSFDGKRTTLNGAELELSGDGVLPSLEPQRQAAEAALELAPLSVAFVAIPGANASACI